MVRSGESQILMYECQQDPDEYTLPRIYVFIYILKNEFYFSDVTYPMGDFMYHSELVIKHGTRNFTAALAKQRAGEVRLA